MTADLLRLLKPKERRGSKPRCHFLTHGSDADVAIRLTSLAAGSASVSPGDRWMPRGFDDLGEPQLDRAPSLVPEELGRDLRRWWLGSSDVRGRTPNWDIASTCTIDDAAGLLLVEAKAHVNELVGAAAGRAGTPESDGDRRTREVIGEAIREARDALGAATGLDWGIDRDSRYQLSNRVAWSWKLTTLGIPVVLVYLGFLDARDVADLGAPFADDPDWERLVRVEAAGCVPDAAWGRTWPIDGVPFTLLIRSIRRDLGSSDGQQG